MVLGIDDSGHLRIRIFDEDGNRIRDSAESELPDTQAGVSGPKGGARPLQNLWSLPSGRAGSSGADAEATMKTRLIRCPSCGATNRVPLDRGEAGPRPVCGR